MRASEILTESQDIITVPAGVWKQVPLTMAMMPPKAEENPYVQRWLTDPTSKGYQLHTPQGTLTVSYTQNYGTTVRGYANWSSEDLTKNLLPLLDKTNLQLSKVGDLRQTPDEIVNILKDHPLELVVKVPGYAKDYAWYTTSIPTFDKYYKTGWDQAELPPGVQGDLYIMRDSNKPGANNMCLVVVDQGKIVAMSGYSYPENPKALLDKIHVQNSDMSMKVMDGKKFVENGQMMWTDRFLFSKPVGKLSDGAEVFEVEPPYRWLVQPWFGNAYANADRVFVVRSKSGSKAVFAVKNAKLVGKKTTTASATDMKRWPELLVKEFNIGVAAAPKSMIKPGSKFHHMLKYIHDNPGGNRTDVFVRGLGRKSTLGAGSIHDATTLDGKAWAGKLIQPFAPGTDKYNYQITARGKMILAMLDSGKSVPENLIVDYTKTS